MFKKKLKKFLCLNLSIALGLGGCWISPNVTPIKEVKASHNSVPDLEGAKSTYTDENGIVWRAVESNGKLYDLYLEVGYAIKPDIVIPEKIQGYTVAGLRSTFLEHTNTNVKYPDGRDTYTVTLPPTIERINDNAFTVSGKLSEVKFSSEPLQKIKVGDSAFVRSNVNEEFVEYIVSNPNLFNLGEYVFNNCSALKELNIESETNIKLNAGTFKRCTNLEKVTFGGNALYLSMYDGCFQDCLNLKEIIVSKGSMCVVGAESFSNTAISKIELNSNYVELYNGAFVGMPELSEFNITSTSLRIYGEPFYGLQFDFGEKIYNSKLETINIDTASINIDIGSEFTGSSSFFGESAHTFQGPFTGLKSLKTVTVGERCQASYFSPYHNTEYGSDHIDYIYLTDSFKTYISKIPSGMHEDSVYIFNLYENNSMEDVNTYGTGADYLYSNLTVGYNNTEVVETKEVNPDNIIVTALNNHTGSVENIPHENNAEIHGYSYTHSPYNLGGNESVSIRHTVNFANMSDTFLAKVVKRKVSDFDIVYKGKQKIEGQNLNTSDFDIENIEYNDGEPETVSASAITVTASALVAGENKVSVTYGGLTKEYLYNAIEKSVLALDAVYCGESEIFSGDIFKKSDLKVTAYFNNGTMSEDFTDYEIVNEIAKEDTVIEVQAGSVTAGAIVNVTPLKGVYLNVEYTGPLSVVAGSNIDKSDLKITLWYNNGNSKILNQNEYTLGTYKIIEGTNTLEVKSIEYPNADVGSFRVLGYVDKTPTPKPTEEPVKTEEPVITKEPVETKEPVGTEEPDKTKEPVETKEPVKTEEPIKTKEPNKPTESVETKEPVKTEEPDKPTKPVKTEEPVETEKPEVTREPEVTKEPVETEKPEVSKNPDVNSTSSTPTITVTPIVSATPVVSSTPNIGPTIQVNTTQTPVSNASTPLTGNSDLKLNVSSIVLGVNDKFVVKSTSGNISKIYSNNDKVALVASTGKIIGKSVGKTQIVVEDNLGKVVTMSVTVKKAPTKISIKGSKKVPLKIGKSKIIKVKFKSGEYGSVKFSSNKKNIVAVLSNGKIVAKKKGSAKVTVKTYNGKKVTIKVKVK